MEKLTVSAGMELMQIMPAIERLRATRDHIYMMLFSAEYIAEREHYHHAMGERVLHMLGARADDPENMAAVFVREFVMLPDALPTLDAENARAGAEDVKRQARDKREAQCIAYATACTIFLNSARTGDQDDPDRRRKYRKVAQNAFLFLNLLWFPGYLDWLCDADPASHPDDVSVLDPDALRNFVVVDVAKGFKACIGGAKQFEDMVSELTSNYILRVGTYNPDMHAMPTSCVPDLPDDYCM